MIVGAILSKGAESGGGGPISEPLISLAITNLDGRESHEAFPHNIMTITESSLKK